VRVHRSWLASLVALTSCATAAPEVRPPAVEVPIQVIRNTVFVATTVTGAAPAHCSSSIPAQIGRSSRRACSRGVYEILPDEPMIDGLLGGDFLQRFRVTLDRTAKQMRLEPLGK
jgi:hypothetical protein